MKAPPVVRLGTDRRRSVTPVGLQHNSRKRLHMGFSSDSQLNDDVLGLDLVELQNYITRLEQRAKNLGGSVALNPHPVFTHRTLYRILSYESNDSLLASSRCTLSNPFFDPPEWIGSGGKGTLRCQIPVENFDLFLEKNKDIAFLVYNKPITQELVEAVEVLLSSKEEYTGMWSEFESSGELVAPYLFAYHQRADWDELRVSVTQSSDQQLIMLWDYIIQKHGDEYAAADACISSGKVTPRFLQYLFKPGDVLVQKVDGSYLGWIGKSWVKCDDADKTWSGQDTDSTREGSKRTAIHKKPETQKWIVDAWHWEFDGSFRQRHDSLTFSFGKERLTSSRTASKLKSLAQKSELESQAILIRDLQVFPLRFAPDEVVDQLRRRGRTFWRCRERGFVCHEESTIAGSETTVNERYMIDLKAYRSLHSNNQYEASTFTTRSAEKLDPEAMKQDEPPDENFELLLPATIKGFNMRRKKWYDLVPERVKDVEWNKEAFQRVLMNRKAKDLIQALVSNQLAMEAGGHGADLIEGKGKRLILLLHGSPGTGKTLTAESVAEIAEKPLYRVTCADIGTEAEEAEKYLESIFHLGKLWRCVVLLDEADVFLEQRSLEDLERNALVSVFLRVLEHYEGILILTSNRVGTFDEAFKSQIQLALYYPALDPYERLQIWKNFLERLEKLQDSSIDIGDLQDHLVDLKEEEMNGRQIRNALTSARQYAKWKNEKLTYAKLKDVIEVAGRFDKYLVKLHKRLTHDQLAEDEGLRLS